MQAPARIFIADDVVHAELLDAVAAELTRIGHTIVRGVSPFAKGESEGPCDDWKSRFSALDLMLVTIRFPCPRELLEAGERLRGVVSPAIGVESIDVDAATELGLVVAHGATPENVIGMAESTVMFMASLFLQFHAKERILREVAPRPKHPLGHMVKGKQVGLIGYGRIGRAVAERLNGWGVHTLVCDPFLSAADLPKEVSLVTLDEILARGDVISLHVDLNEKTKNLISDRELRLMKSSAYLINTSRGGLVDERALYEALKSRRIAGAAIDTYATEPLPADSPLRELENAILTPHMIGQTAESQASFLPVALENIQRLLRGAMPLYVKNPSAIPAWRKRIDLLESNILVDHERWVG